MRSTFIVDSASEHRSLDLVSNSSKKIWLVQRGVWDMEVESMPLASGYFKAITDADEALRSELDLRIFNFGGGDGVLEMMKTLFFENEIPDVVAFSVFGWNVADFGRISETFRQLNAEGWIIFGGTHVTDQASRVFGAYPDVDIVVNGEGELTFLELMRAVAADRSRHELHDIHGISFKTPDGETVTTEARERIDDLDVVPSPLLTGTLPLLDHNGKFKYDVVLMETNRGCPYKCAFCYWGGATGQKLRKFSADRIAEEIELCGYHQIPDVVLCDANFGMLREDEQFVETMIKVREKYGFPKNFETSWAKNKGRIFFSIVKRMKEVGMRSSFTLALQTLSPGALEQMGRKNMKLNEWQGLAEWLKRERLDSYAELIWGVPGETYDSFLEGYDRLAAYVSRIAVYPHLILPNTDFSKDRDRHQFVLMRGEHDDFEYVLAHRDMSYDDNKKMHYFLFWARVVAENQILRHIWIPLRELAGMTQSQVLLSLDDWFSKQKDSVSQGVLACRREIVDSLDASRVTRGIHYFYLEHGVNERIEAWWNEEIMPRVPEAAKDFFKELIRYDQITKPIFNRGAGVRRRSRNAEADHELPRTTIGGEEYFVRENIDLLYDVPAVIETIANGEQPRFEPTPHSVTLYYKVGFAKHVDNHEFVERYVGKTMQQLKWEEQERMGRSIAAPVMEADAEKEPDPRRLPVLT